MNGINGRNLNMIGKRVGIAVIALTVAGAWALPASAGEVSVAPTPAAEVAVAPTTTPRTAGPAHRVVKPRVVKRFWRHRPIRVAAAEWSSGGGRHWAVSHVVLGVGF
jgi:hypothetical protein